MAASKRTILYAVNYRIVIGALALVGLLNSCVTNRKTIYLQDRPESEYTDDFKAPDYYKIQPSDNLFIRVTTPDPKWSAMFNTMPTGGTTFGSSPQSVDLLSYSVNLDGTVEIPYLGAIHVVGKTLPETKVIMEEALSDYVTDAAITVKLVNNYVSVLGEVNAPGRYPIYKEYLNILEAVTMAGDLAVYGNRSKIRVIRKSEEGTIVKELDLTDRKIVDSEYYYVMPNDVIYVEPLKGRFFGMSQFPYGVVISTITTFLLILNYIQRQ